MKQTVADSDSYDAAWLAPAVDCLQLDVTRCGGYTGWQQAAAVAAAHNLQVSGHCAPALHAPIAAAIPNLRHVEYFIDHARLEPLLVEGTPAVAGGKLHLDPSCCRARHVPARGRAPLPIGMSGQPGQRE